MAEFDYASITEPLMALLNRTQAEQKAEQQIFQSKTKEALQQKEEATQVQLANAGRATILRNQDNEQIAAGVQQLTDALQADPTDPTSLMARNNVAITALNEQLLNQYNAIDAVQRDDSVVGMLNNILNLPDMLAGADQLQAQRNQFIAANTALHNNLANQTNQISSSIKLADTEAAQAEAAAEAAKTMAALAHDKLTSAATYFQIQHMASQDALATASKVAELKQQQIMMPLQVAIMKNQVAEFEQQQEVDAMLSNAMGWPSGASKRMLAGMKTNPQAYNAAVAFATSGKLYNSFDAQLLEPYMNKQGLTNPDGSAKPSLQVVHEMARPVIAARTNELMQEFITAQRAAQMTDAELNKLLNNPGMLKIAIDKFKTSPAFKKTAKPSDMATWNPAQVFREIPRLAAQVPLIHEVVNASADKTTDIKPDDLLNVVVKSNADVKPADIASQFATYYQNVLAHDATRPIYGIAGIDVPDSVKEKVSRAGMLARYSMEQSKFLSGKGAISSYVKAHPIGATGTAAVDFTNSAELEDYIREVRLRAELNIANNR